MIRQQEEVASFTPEACMAVLERAASSPQLKRASRLREFLFYVASKSLKENAADIHEQEIGHVVFGRNEHYDTSQDNIVRVNATELRKRIDAYFENEGVNEPLIFDIPRGSYSPVFRKRVVHSPEVISTEKPTAAVSKPLYANLPLTIVSGIAIVLAIACAFLWMTNQSMRKVLHAWEGQPALAALWPKFFNSQQETDIVLADTSFTLIEDITQKTTSLSEYLNRDYINELQSPNFADNRRILEMLASRNYGSLGDFRVAQQIEALDWGSKNVFVDYAREYSTDSIKRDNVVLIGSKKSNPWVDLFSDQMNFDIEYDQATDQNSIRNHNPRPGEKAQYVAPPASQNATLGYSIIAYLPNPSHTANALIIEGTNSEATNAAGDFVTSETSMEGFLQRLHTKQFPYFEVLLRTTRMSGTPFHAEIIAYRTY